jgi:putative DNA primase/helicase
MFEGGGGAIGLAAFESASLIAAWHLSEARRFFGELALPAELADAARLDSWLIEHCRQGRTHMVGKNHVRQHGPLRDGARLDTAIRELTELDRLQLVKDGKRLTIHLNPALVIRGDAS